MNIKSVAGVVFAAALVLMLPLLAMQFNHEVTWDLADFAIAGALLVGTGLMYLLVASKSNHVAYRAAAGVALAAGLLLVWINLAVGIIGSEDNPANAMYAGVLAVGIIGAIIARFQPRGMARALFATALVQAVVTAVALVLGRASPWTDTKKTLVLNGFFIALFVASALLFRRAAREPQ